jgi:hypothetical protein
VKSSAIYARPFFFIVALVASKMVKIMSDQILTVWENNLFFGIDVFVFFILVASNFVDFENKKCDCKKKLPNVNCRAFHAASCGIFCFFSKTYQVMER